MSAGGWTEWHGTPRKIDRAVVNTPRTLGSSPRVVPAAQSGQALALSWLMLDNGGWIEAQEIERLVLDSSDAIGHCMLVGTG